MLTTIDVKFIFNCLFIGKFRSKRVLQDCKYSLGQFVKCRLWVEFLSALYCQVLNKKDLSSCVHVLYKTSHWKVSLRSRAVDVKEMYQKTCCKCIAVVLLVSPMYFDVLVAVVVMVALLKARPTLPYQNISSSFHFDDCLTVRQL